MLRSYIATVGQSISNFFRSTPAELQDHPTSQSQSWTTHDSNLALFECLAVANSRRPALPPEIIMLILSEPSRWIEIHRESYLYPASPDGVPSSFYEGTDIYPILRTRPLSADEAAGLTRILFKFCTQDQGWSSYPQHHGTYHQSYTWMETGISEGDGSEGTQRWELQRNRHAGQRPEFYTVELDRHHKLLKCLEEGDSIGMWARASFPGWAHHVFGASIDLVFYDIDNLEE